MSQMTLKIKKVGMKNPKTKVLGFASRVGRQRFHAAESRVMLASTMPRQGKGRMKSNGTQEFSEVCELAGLNRWSSESRAKRLAA